MSSPEHKQKIWNYIKEIKVGMLVTDDENSYRGRPMHLVQKDYDGTLWFFTNKNSEKITEIQEDNSVCLTFSGHREDVYVSLSGHAKVTQDKALIERFWNPFAAAWFPEGKDSPEVALLEVKIVHGEHWDADDSKIVQLFKIAKANITSTEPDMGENQKF